jgi:hypothetical protein
VIVFVGFEVLTAVVMNSTIFWDITPCSLLPPAFMLVSCSAYFSTLKMEAMGSSETSVDNVLHGVISQKMVLFSDCFM